MSERKRVRIDLRGAKERARHPAVRDAVTNRVDFPSGRKKSEAADDDGTADHGEPETVLLAEDEAVIRSLLVDILKRDGYRVLAAGNGPEALSVAAAHVGPIRLLVTDLVMPGMNGREIAERLAAVRPGIRVLFISGYSTNEVSQPGVLATNTAFLQKPFAPHEFLRKVREVLDAPP